MRMNENQTLFSICLNVKYKLNVKAFGDVRFWKSTAFLNKKMVGKKERRMVVTANDLCVSNCRWKYVIPYRGVVVLITSMLITCFNNKHNELLKRRTQNGEWIPIRPIIHTHVELNIRQTVLKNVFMHIIIPSIKVQISRTASLVHTARSAA